MSKNEIRHYESLEEALMCCITLSNKEIKQVAMDLWPSDPERTAYQRLIEALNPNKRQKLSLHEIIWICNYCERYDPLYWMADECLHERPEPKVFEKAEAEIKREMESLMQKVTKQYQDYIVMAERRDKAKKIRDGMHLVSSFRNGTE